MKQIIIEFLKGLVIAALIVLVVSLLFGILDLKGR